MTQILIVEDDRLLNQGIAYMLKKAGYDPISVFTSSEAWEKYMQDPSIGLIVLDINLPDGSGMELCTQIRLGSEVPIVVLTANDTEQDIIQGFETGCDDYIAKPFSVEVLKQRIQAVLRRVKKEGRGANRFLSGELVIDYDKMTLTKAGTPIRLTATEYKLLELLTRCQGQVLTREMIVEKLWDIDGNFVEANALSVNIRRLRQKIEDDPKHPVYIQTVFGIGYTWGSVS